MDSPYSPSRRLPDMCRQDNVSLLCIDSIGGLARNEYDIAQKDQMFERTTTLFRLSQRLKWLSDTFGVCVVVVNQVWLTVEVPELLFNHCPFTRPLLFLISGVGFV